MYGEMVRVKENKKAQFTSVLQNSIRGQLRGSCPFVQMRPLFTT